MKIALLTSSNPGLMEELKPGLIITERSESEIKEILDKENPDVVVLSDYNKVIRSPKLLEEYKDKFINIHLSYLPEFPGYKAHEQAWKAKTKVSGYTLHQIVKEVDAGKILKQERVNIEDCKSAEEIKKKLSETACKGLKELIATLKIPSF